MTVYGVRPTNPSHLADEKPGERTDCIAAMAAASGHPEIHTLCIVHLHPTADP